ncbi:unnamed protein product [Onchocerca ochengi]|uniref:Tudor domain-containing protein n=1 Tax=Onchocerca ochengi TaxID=42157 RepID=A0A182ELH1_ONCOC|nr:unnamed protein product [Onchocerca ochengi]
MLCQIIVRLLNPPAVFSNQQLFRLLIQILLVNIVLIDEPLGRFRIQAFFRLRTFERAYKLFEKKMCFHYLFYGEEKDYVVEKPVKDCNYAFHDIKDNQVYRVRCLDDGGHAGVVPVYFIDQMRHQNVPISQLRKLTNDYVKPAYGVVAKTAPFIIVSGREDEFRKSFSQICSKLLEHSEQDIQADVVSEPSKNLFELKQIFSEAHGGLKIPAAFMRQNLIQMNYPHKKELFGSVFSTSVSSRLVSGAGQFQLSFEDGFVSTSDSSEGATAVVKQKGSDNHKRKIRQRSKHSNDC